VYTKIFLNHKIIFSINIHQIEHFIAPFEQYLLQMVVVMVPAYCCYTYKSSASKTLLLSKVLQAESM